MISGPKPKTSYMYLMHTDFDGFELFWPIFKRRVYSILYAIVYTAHNEITFMVWVNRAPNNHMHTHEYIWGPYYASYIEKLQS